MAAHEGGRESGREGRDRIQVKDVQSVFRPVRLIVSM